ncbi:hypothetical protein [Oceanirhabdus seepicola]|uniref:Uncharacterized protein n=1 Tax=Oceanirhabdus seepicola TaxID=2828781 RepID=A0A9J6NX31_9CLOT|nr:hypothetical protein [Oceanirhabdus seepicola]MCM1989071.1 hypothetical protein [Oceanirhabdus seepicola]
MISKILSVLLPIGLLIQIINIICSHYNIFSDFARDFLTRMSGVFMIVGLVFFVYNLIKKKNKLV